MARWRLALFFVPAVAVGLAVALVVGVFTVRGVGRQSGHGASRTGTQASGAQSLVVASDRAGGPTPGVSASDLPSSPTSPSGVATRTTGGLPVTSDPRRYAIAYARALFSYDTRTQSESAWVARLSAGLDTAADVRVDNAQDLADRTPPAAVWNTMVRSEQHASFTVARAWAPELWTQNASRYPAGAAAVTVSGTQQVVWAGGASEVAQSLTLLLLCPPYNDACVVNRIAAQVLR